MASARIPRNSEVTLGAPGDTIATTNKKSKSREGQRAIVNKQEDNLRATGLAVGTGMAAAGTYISTIPFPIAQAVGRPLQIGGTALVIISANTACPAPIAAAPQSTTQGPPLQKKPEDIDPSKTPVSEPVLEVPGVGYTDGYKVYRALILIPDENATRGIEIVVREKNNNSFSEISIIPNAYILKNIKGNTEKYLERNREKYKDPNLLIKKDNYLVDGKGPNVSVDGARIARIRTKKDAIIDLYIGTDGKLYVSTKPLNENYAISMCSANGAKVDTKLRYDFKRIPKSPLIQRIKGDILFAAPNPEGTSLHTGKLDYRQDKTYIKTVIPSIKDNLDQIFINPDEDKLIFKPNAKEIIESLDIPQDQKSQLLSLIEPNEETLISRPKNNLYHYID